MLKSLLPFSDKTSSWTWVPHPTNAVWSSTYPRYRFSVDRLFAPTGVIATNLPRFSSSNATEFHRGITPDGFLTPTGAQGLIAFGWPGPALESRFKTGHAASHGLS